MALVNMVAAPPTIPTTQAQINLVFRSILPLLLLVFLVEGDLLVVVFRVVGSEDDAS